MAATYLVLPLIFQREIVWPKLAKIQPYLFGIGVAGISLFMMGAGTLGVSRRHWDISFSDAELSFAHSAGAYLMMGLNGVFAIIAALGGAIFVIVVVCTVLFGKRITGGHKLTFPLHSGGGATVSHYGSYATAKLPGTAILVAIFFVCFVLYYFINWKYLSELWLFR
jgi:cytochrome c oxidase subunit 1